MEKNLNKYLTLEEASKQNYITTQMITQMIEKNQIPYFSEKGIFKVFPGDIAAAINELFGITREEKKRKIEKTNQSDPAKLDTVLENEN